AIHRRRASPACSCSSTERTRFSGSSNPDTSRSSHSPSNAGTGCRRAITCPAKPVRGSRTVEGGVPVSSSIPPGVDIAAAWAWRCLLIVGAVFGIGWLVGTLSTVVVPVVVALLLTALLSPGVNRLHRGRLNRAVSTAIVMVGGIALIVSGLTLVGQQIVDGFDDLSEQIIEGLREIETWVREGPLNLTDAQVADLLRQGQDWIAQSNSQIVNWVQNLGSAVGHFVAGAFIMLFTVFFFVYDGERIWRWIVVLFPSAARADVDASGRVAWQTLTAFVRATVIVAMVDAVGIMLIALVLQVPLVIPIGVLVFLASFVPIVGAMVSGFVAVIVALVAHGPVVALLMLIGVLLIQQLESHILQPFLLGRAVRIHPLAVVLAISVGILLAGVFGALVAVPLAASANAVVSHLTHRRDEAEREPAASDTKAASDTS
ncbi:MAG: AI-2E family transporter, partial [Propionibacteriales bacterium]|nr:AI-2E family transporter [Propionibacteriales bacterium]